MSKDFGLIAGGSLWNRDGPGRMHRSRLAQDESGHRHLLAPVLPGPGEDIQGPGVTVVGGLDIGLQTALPVIIGVTEDESIGGRISLHHLFHKGHVTSRHVVLVGRQNKNAAGAGDKRGIAALFFTGEPG